MGCLRVYSKINATIGGKVAIKLHTGEPHGPNIVPREMVRALQQHIPNSCLVETNTFLQGPAQHDGRTPRDAQDQWLGFLSGRHYGRGRSSDDSR